jgi:AraC-like DNA-binding protein
MLKGSGNFKVNTTNIILDKYSFLVLNKGSKLSFKLFNGDNSLAILYFNTELSNVISNSLLLKDKNNSENYDFQDYTLIEHVHFMNSTLKNYLELLISLGNSCASFHSLKADMVVRGILNGIISENHTAIRVSSNLNVVKTTTKVQLYQRITMAKSWMEKYHGEDINMKQASEIAMLNEHHFLRLFKKAFGLTPHQFLIKTRLRKAAYLLKNTDKSVSEICYSIGFESLSSFSTLFKKRLGITPTKYRLS